MKFISKSEKEAMSKEETDKLEKHLVVTDDAFAIIETIKEGFERMRISTLMKK